MTDAFAAVPPRTGAWYVLAAELPALCCPYVIPAGAMVLVKRRQTKNRATVLVGTGYHRVKASSLRRVGEEAMTC
jgi:hypothetical protein